MAKLSDILAKKSGTLLLTRDLAGKACLVTEDILADTDVRETEDGKYLCVQVKVDGVIRDWNPTLPQMRVVVAALGKPENLKGKMFQITGSTKDGFQSKTVAIELRGDYVPYDQTRLPVPPAPTAAVVDGVRAAEKISDMAVMLGAIEVQPKGHVAGDAALAELALLVCGGDVTKANFLLGVLHSSGRIKNEGGCWSVTK